ncbi:MAG: cytochrome C [Rhodospirillales bacterium]|nr:cytochrome C [Rhodospirillales bacterium]
MRSWFLFLALSSVLGGPAQAAPERLVGHGGPVKAVVAAEEGGRVLTASFDYAVGLWEISDSKGRLLRRLIGHEAAVNDVAFLADGRRAISVSDDGTAIVWDLERGTVLGRFGETPVKALDVEVSPDGRLAAVAKWDRRVLVIDLETMTLVSLLEGNRDRVNAVAFARDGSALYSGDSDGSLRRWSLPLPEKGIAPHAVLREQGWGINVLRAVAGAVVVGAVDGTVLVVPDKGEARELFRFEQPVMALARSADGSQLAAGAGDGQMRVWDIGSWEERKVLLNDLGPVWGLSFDAEGEVLWFAGLDDEVYSLPLTGPPKALPEPKERPRRFHLMEGLDLGAREFQRKCSVCHTLTPDDANRAGPTLYRLFGRRAGSLPGYPYSQALLDSAIVWNEETVAALFDHGPDVVTPGTKMPIQRITDPERRNALVRFLKGATGGLAPDADRGLKEQE